MADWCGCFVLLLEEYELRADPWLIHLITVPPPYLPLRALSLSLYLYLYSLALSLSLSLSISLSISLSLSLSRSLSLSLPTHAVD